MSEPFTAASFIMTSLAYTSQYDHASIPRTPMQCVRDHKRDDNPIQRLAAVAQHPFLDGNPAGSASGSAMTSIKRVYVSNDSTNLYCGSTTPRGPSPRTTRRLTSPS